MTAPHPPTEEHRLYLAARDMLGDPSPDTLLVVDFSGLAHIDDPTLWNAVAGGIRDRLGGEARDSFTLRHHRVALRLEGHRCADTRPRLDELAGFLAGHNHGRLTWRCFDLPRDGDGFLAFLRELKADGIASDAPPDDAVDLEELIRLEEVMATADLSNLVRERPVWSFVDPQRPVLVERELLTSIPDLSAVTGIDVRRTPWLFGKALSVLDGRMMSHVVREPGHHHGRFALNLRAASVLTDAFTKFVADLPVGESRGIAVEITHAEWQLNGEQVGKALQRLESLKIRATLDGIPLTALATLEPPAGVTGLLKIDWDDALAAADATAAAATAQSVARLGIARCALLHVDAPDRVDAARRHGFVVMEGRAAEWEAKQMLARREAAAAPPADVAEEEPPPAPSRSLAARLFGRLFGGRAG